MVLSVRSLLFSDLWTLRRVFTCVCLHSWNCPSPDFLNFAVTLPFVPRYDNSWPSLTRFYPVCSHISRPWSTFSSSSCSRGSCTHELPVGWKRSSSGRASRNFSSPFGLCSVWTAETRKHSCSRRSVSCRGVVLLGSCLS